MKNREFDRFRNVDKDSYNNKDGKQNKVIVTDHAIERYAKRIAKDERSKMFASYGSKIQYEASRGQKIGTESRMGETVNIISYANNIYIVGQHNDTVYTCYLCTNSKYKMLRAVFGHKGKGGKNKNPFLY